MRESKKREGLRRSKVQLCFLGSIFYFISLSICPTKSFGSIIENSASVSYKINNVQQEISTNPVSTTIDVSTEAVIVAPKNDSTVPREFTVFGTTTTPEALVEVRLDAQTKYSLNSDVNGYYSQEILLTPGSHTITVFCNGIEGETVNVEAVSEIPADYPKVETPSPGERITTRRPQITGKTSPNSSVAIYAQASPIKIVGTGSADGAGNFIIDLNQDLSSGKTQLFVLDTTNNLASKICEVVFIDPEGVVFDSITGNPIKGAEVTLYNAVTNELCRPGVEIHPEDKNPYITGADGHYSFYAIDGNYYLRVTATGYIFPSALSVFPLPVAVGSKGEQFTIAGIALRINLPMDAEGSLLKIEKDVNKREVTIGDILTYTVTIKNETTSDIKDVYLEDKIPSGFKYIQRKAILDDRPISDPTIGRVLTFNIGTVAANTSRTLKYQLIAGSGVGFGNYENVAFAKYLNGKRLSNIATETVKVVADPLFDLGTVIGKVFNDINENGIQDLGEETIPYARIVTEEGIIITADKDGKWHLIGLIPGRHLFRIDESSLPEGSYLTTEKAVIVEISRGILSKVNFGVKISPEKLREIKEIDLQVSREKSPLKLRLNVALYPDNLGMRDGMLVDEPVFKIYTNYHLFIKKWRLEIFEKDTKQLFKRFEGEDLDYENTISWDGLSDKDELVKTDKTYYYILTVWNKKDRSDTVIAKEFKVEELKKEEALKRFALTTQEREREFEEWDQSQKKLTALEKQTISVKGETIKIKARAQKEGAKLRLSLGEKISAPAISEEKIDIEIILPEGVHKLRLIQESPEGESESVYERQLKVGDDYLFFVVLGDLKTGYTFSRGNVESIQADDKFKEGLWKEGRLSYYLKGKIRGKYLVTSSFDTSRQRKELFKIIDPKKYYPVYGDAASINYEATDTQGKLYCLIEWDRSKAIWGNYFTGFSETEFAKFNRTLYGAKLHYESVSTTKFGQPNTKLILFDAKVKQLASRNEFTGTGGSLYYLKHKNIIEGSDLVKIEVRDKITGLALASLEQKNGIDYHLDYSQGRILFWKPVSKIAESNSIISTHLLDGNLVYVVVDYEYEPKDKYYQGTYGIRLAQFLSDYLQIGASYVKEERPKENYELKGIDTTFYINQDTIIRAEYAESRSEQVSSFISGDGGLTFTQITSSGSISGKAYGLKGETKLFDRVGLNSYYNYVSRDFASSDSASQGGTEKYGFGINWNIAKNTFFNLRYDVQRLLDSGNIQTQAQVGAKKTETTTAQITHTKDRLTFTAEYRHQQTEAKLTGIQAQTNQDTDIIAAKVNYKVSERLETSLEHQETIKGDNNRQTTIGVIYRIVVEWLKIKFSQVFGTKGTATILGADAKISKGKTQVFVEQTYGSNLDQTKNTSTSLGIKSQLTEKREVYGVFTTSHTSQEGKKRVFSFGGAQRLTDKLKLFTNRDVTTTKESVASTNVLGLSGDVNDKLSVNIAFEKGKVNNLTGSRANRHSGSIGLTYLEKDRLKISSKLELRSDRGTETRRQYLVYNSMEYTLDKTLTLFGKLNLSKMRNTTTATTEAKFNEITFGTAFRPVNWDRLNFIAKYTRFENKQPSGQSSFSNITAEKASVFALEGIYELTDRIQLVEKIACKWGKEKVSGFDFTPSQTWLWINRLNYKLNKYWGLSGEYRILTQRQAKDKNQGFLLEVNRDVGDSLQLAAGFNFSRFSDDLVHNNNYSCYGPYFRITVKFFDRTPEERVEIKRRRAERRRVLELKSKSKRKLANHKSSKNYSPSPSVKLDRTLKKRIQ